jgi:hypothetical protein
MVYLEPFGVCNVWDYVVCVCLDLFATLLFVYICMSRLACACVLLEHGMLDCYVDMLCMG